MNASHLPLLAFTCLLAVGTSGWASPITCPHEGVQPQRAHLSYGGEFMPEAVTIELYDMSVSPPELLTYTHGGSNSLQGYGPHGGATTVEEVGPEDVQLFLQRPVCVRVAEVPFGDAAAAE